MNVALHAILTVIAMAGLFAMLWVGNVAGGVVFGVIVAGLLMSY